MKKITILTLFFQITLNSFSQDWDKWLENRADSLKTINNKQTLSSLFYNTNSDGLIYVGVTNSFEFSSYFIGGEFKLYDSYYTPLFGLAVYSNYRYSPYNNPQRGFNAISIGANFSLIGMEFSVYFREKHSYVYFNPKIGFDYGSWSVHYGYNFAVSKPKFASVSGHNISFKYYLYMSSLKHHKSRKKSMRY